jgi:predicted kinase
MLDPDRSPTSLLVLVTGLQGTGKSTVAEEAARLLETSVLSHDWVMSGLRPFEGIQRELESMEPPGHQIVGWAILGALARAQLRRGSSVVLDGMARATDAERCRQVAEQENSRLVVILTECADAEVHRSRIEDRHRGIPNWYELDWDDVQRSRTRWAPPDPVDLVLQATDAPLINRGRLVELFKGI